MHPNFSLHLSFKVESIKVFHIIIILVYNNKTLGMMMMMMNRIRHWEMCWYHRPYLLIFNNRHYGLGYPATYLLSYNLIHVHHKNHCLPIYNSELQWNKENILHPPFPNKLHVSHLGLCPKGYELPLFFLSLYSFV